MATTDFAAPRRLTLTVERLRNISIWVAVFISGYVLVEPSPHELYLVLAFGAWLAAGLAIPRETGPLLVLLLLFTAGGLMAVHLTRVDFAGDAMVYALVSGFMALIAIFYAAVIADDWRRLDVIANAAVWIAVVVALIGILAYFHLIPGSDLFLLYDRARSTFMDPNVYGPFLMFPALILFRRIMVGRLLPSLPLLVPFGIILLGIFLSFSRAAWGLTAFALLLLGAVVFVNTRSARTRARYLMIALLGIAFLAVLLVAALSVPAVSDLFAQRAQLTQGYDTETGSELGRFARHWAGFARVPALPLGLGPIQFGVEYGSATHNVYLNAFMSYGWLGGFSLILLLLWTLAAGFPLLFKPRPWQALYQCAYVAFLAHLFIAWVIDVDHWRHFYLLLGVIWGVIAVEKISTRRLVRPAPATTPG